jgi:4-hydroxy-3-polyprenylbenzoate decarboxylase
MISVQSRCMFSATSTSLLLSDTLTCRSARLSMWNLRPRSHLPQNHAIRSLTIGNTSSRRKRIVVAVTGATGAPLAVQLLQRLRVLGVETHLILSIWGLATLKYELSAPNNTAQYLKSLADTSYSPKDVSAPLSSGSFHTDGMIVVPCSMKTLAGIRIGYDNDLITRAAGVTLKERRKLVLVARETPLSSIHLENMLEVTKAGAVIFPPVMAFYTRPKCVEDMVQQSVQRMVDCFEIGAEKHDTEQDRWTGFGWNRKNDEGNA